MAQLAPIRIGETFQRTYLFKNPDESPIDLSNIDISFCLRHGLAVAKFESTEGVVVTPLLGKIEVELEADQTEELGVDRAAVSYLEFEYPDGNVKTKCRRAEQILTKDMLEII